MGVTLRGIPASGGIAAGPARVISKVSDIEDVRQNHILVARHASPELYPHLLTAAGLVAATGGLACHLAIIARQLAKPCVTAVKEAFEFVMDGDMISLDGFNGTVITASPEPFLNCKRANHGIVDCKVIDAEYPGVLHFGRFSAAWNHANCGLTPLLAIQLAAFIAAPKRIGAHNFSRIRIEVDTLRINRADIEVTQKAFVDFTLSHPNFLLDEYSTLKSTCEQFSASNTIAQHKNLIRRFFKAYQIVWLAFIGGERLMSYHRDLICSKLDCSNSTRSLIDSTISYDVSFLNQSQAVTDKCSSRAKEALLTIRKSVRPKTYRVIAQISESIRCLLHILEAKRTALSKITLQLSEESKHFSSWQITESSTDFISHIRKIANDLA